MTEMSTSVWHFIILILQYKLVVLKCTSSQHSYFFHIKMY